MRCIAAILSLIALWRGRARQRARLGCLDEDALRDIGIDRLRAAAEAAKPFWRP